MGAWGTGNFDNDDALDWLADLEAEGLVAADGALRAVVDLTDDYLEAPVCCAGLAAAEVVAALRGQRPDALPQQLERWLDRMPDVSADGLVAVAREAVDAIVRDSELRELWEESGDFGEWERAVADLRGRLS